MRIVRGVNAMDELLGTRAQPERWSLSGSLCAEVGTDVPSFPHPLSSLRLSSSGASDSFSLTKPNTFCKIEWPASLRSEGVRVHPGMPFGFPSETAFGFAGISFVARNAKTLSGVTRRRKTVGRAGTGAPGHSR